MKAFTLSLFGHLLLLCVFFFSLSWKKEHPRENILPVYISHSHQESGKTSHKLLSTESAEKNLKKTSIVSVCNATSYETQITDKFIDKPLLKLLHDSIAAQQTYPENALELKQTGTVRMKFVLHPDGQITQVALANSSGFRELDEAAEAALRASSPIRQVNIYITQPKFMTIDVVFRL